MSAGETIAITAGGELDWQTTGCTSANNCTSGPDGPGPSVCNPNNPNPSPYPSLPCNSLIGVISSTGTPFEVGTSLNTTASVSGELYLGVNDGYLPDNSLGWQAVITLTANCSQHATFDPNKLSVTSYDPYFWTHVQEDDGIPDLYVYAGNFISDPWVGHPRYDAPYAINIDADDALAYDQDTDPNDKPRTVIVQNLFDWAGYANYQDFGEEDSHYEWRAVVSPTQPLPLALLDAPNNDSPYYRSDMRDTPNIHVPLRDLDNRPVRAIHYIKSFKAYIGCIAKADNYKFHPVVVVPWEVHFYGHVFYPPFGEPIVTGFRPVTHGPPASAVGVQVQTKFPNAICYTRYINFDGQPTPSQCKGTP